MFEYFLSYARGEPGFPRRLESSLRTYRVRFGDGPGLESDAFQLKISTANGTTWESIKAYVEKIKMCVICVQDHKITTQLGLDAASDWCCRNGGKSRWSMFNPSDCG